MRLADARGLLSKEHFSVDGTLIQAWASQKGFRPKDGSDDQRPGGRNAQAEASGWRALIVYRGKYCPICKSYLTALNHMREEFRSAGVAVSAVSADTREKAEAEVAECGWTFPVGHYLSIDDMRQLGVYVSDPRSPQEADRPFAEPALFVINPDAEAQIIDISNAPFPRPDLKSLLNGLQFVISKDYPMRGRA